MIHIDYSIDYSIDCTLWMQIVMHLTQNMYRQTNSYSTPLYLPYSMIRFHWREMIQYNKYHILF